MMGLPTTTTMTNGYRCGSSTSSSSGRGSSIQHASLPRHFNTPPINSNGELVGLPTVSAHIPLQHHNMSYMRPYRHNNQAAPPPPPQYNSHYRGQTMQHHRGVGGVGHPSDYAAAAVKFNGQREIDVWLLLCRSRIKNPKKVLLPSKTKTSFMPTQITVISTRTGLYLTLKPAVLPLRPKKRNWLNATELSDAEYDYQIDELQLLQFYIITQYNHKMPIHVLWYDPIL